MAGFPCGKLYVWPAIGRQCGMRWVRIGEIRQSFGGGSMVLYLLNCSWMNLFQPQV
jgi:hypothetical protein